MRAILDTNIFISAVINPHGTPAKILDAWRNNQYDLLLSQPMLSEIADVITRPRIRARHGWSDDELEAFLVGLELFAVTTPDKLEIDEIEDDPDDDKFLVCAVEGMADYIVSGDSHLLDLESYQDVPIVTARELLEILSEIS